MHILLKAKAERADEEDGDEGRTLLVFCITLIPIGFRTEFPV